MSLQLSKHSLVKLLDASATSPLGDITFSGTEFDSRNIRTGNLFLAWRGEKAHGHEYLDSAMCAGAALAIVEDERLLEISPHRDRLIAVPDSIRALRKLAAYWRSEYRGHVIGVAGSIGKTSTKELCYSLLSAHGHGAASKKSFNNHIGVPYTMTNSPLTSDWIVLEMGMNRPGELRELAQLSKPDIALITCIAPEHTEFFPTLDDIADAECEIVEGLSGTLIINGDDENLTRAVDRKRAHFAPTEIKRFGTSRHFDMRLSDVQTRGLEGIEFTLENSSERKSIRTHLLGRQTAINVAAAALATQTLYPSTSLASFEQALQKFSPPPMRLNLCKLSDGRTIIDDSYNSSPVALRAAIDILGELAQDGMKIGAVLGDMLELGERSDEYHREIGEALTEIDLSFLITVGPQSRKFEEAIRRRRKETEIVSASSAEHAGEEAARKGFEVLLVKGSRGIGLERVVATMRKHQDAAT